MTSVAETLVDRLDRAGVEASLHAQGFAPLPVILERDECDALAALYKDDSRFRSRIDMARFREGVGWGRVESPANDQVRAISLD
jgi:hypothetical protein